MTHTLTAPVPYDTGFLADCSCGYQTNVCRSAEQAELYATRHVQMSTNHIDRKPRERPAIDIETAAASFLSLLLWGLDENVSATRGGWPR